jgi:hypothetical protein
MALRMPQGVCVRARLVHLRCRVYFRTLVQQQPHDLDVAVVRRGGTGGPPVLPDQKERRVGGVDGARRQKSQRGVQAAHDENWGSCCGSGLESRTDLRNGLGFEILFDSSGVLQTMGTICKRLK